MEKKCRKVTVFFKSRHSDDKYKTERHRTGRITCFCPGYVYTGNCWHCNRVATYKI